MKISFPVSAPVNLRVFVACLLAFSILITPIAAMAAPRVLAAPKTRREAKKLGSVSGTATKAATGNEFANGPVPEPAPAPPFAAVITASMTDNRPATDPASAKPGDTINYTATITNTGNADATSVQFNDDLDLHTAYVNGSGILAMSDSYSTIGNTNISVAAPGLLTNDLDLSAGNNTGMTTTAQTVSSSQCAGCNNVTINANGSFTYDPKVGFTGTDTFTYTAKNAANKPASATVQVTVAGMIWYVKNDAPACTVISTPCGTLAHPFSTLASFQAVNDGGAGPPQHPKANDNIFIYTGVGNYTGGVTLLNGQKLIGQGATASLETITGLPTPSGSTVLPTTGGVNPVFTTGSLTDNIRLGTGNSNLIRGFTVGDSGTATGDSSDITGTSIGTLTVSEVTLNGSGRTMNINGGALSGSFTSVASTASTGQGLTLTAVTGTINMGSTTISGFSTGCISVSNTAAAVTSNINFGNTSCTSGGSEGINLTNNASGLRTFGSLTVSGVSATAFIHASAGGDVNITGAANLTSTGGNVISVSSPANGDLIDFQAATSATTGGNQVTGINWVGAAGATMQFNSLSIQRNNGIALNATTGGTITVTNATGTINNTTAGGPAIVANAIDLNANFSAINSSASAPTGTSAVSLTNVTGTSNFGGGALTNASGATFLVSGSTCSVTYTGNITQANNAAMVSVLNGHSGTLTFTGTLNASNGTGLQFNDADGSYNFSTTAGTTTLSGGDAGIDILAGSAGTFTFGPTGTPANFVVTSPSGIAVNIDGVASTSTANVTYRGNITQANNAATVVVKNHNTGTISFQVGAISASNGTGLQFDNADSTYSFNNVSGTTSLSGGDAGVDITNGSGGSFTFGPTGTPANFAITNPTGIGFNFNTSTAAVTFNGNITKSGTSTGAIVDITGQSSGTITFQNGSLISSSTAATATGINLNNVDGTVNFNGTNTLSGAGANAGIDITNGSSGTISFSANTSITSPSGAAYNEDTSTANVTYNGTITQNSAASAVKINVKTGGTTTFTRAAGSQISASTGAANAIDLTGNTTAGTINFQGGLSLTSSTGTAFNVSGGSTASTLNVTQNNGAIVNTINSTDGSGLFVNNATIGASGLTFRSISAGKGAAATNGNGITLDTTGATAGLTVTGNGGNCTIADTTCSGGFIQRKNGADGSATSGSGIFLNSTVNPSFTLMHIKDVQNSGIRGTSVTGFSLTSSVINGINGTTALGGSEEGAVRFVNLFTSATFPNAVITDCVLGGITGSDSSFSDNLRVSNSSGTLNRLSITNTSFGNISTGGNNGLTFSGSGAAAMTMNLTVQDSVLTNAIGSVASITFGTNTTMDLVFRRNKLSNNNVNQSSGGGGLAFQGGSGAHTVTYDISCNTLRDSIGIALLVATGNGSGTVVGNIINNKIGVSGSTTLGSTQASAIKVKATGTGTHTTMIQNNQMFGTNEEGIFIQNNDGSATLNASVFGNTYANPNTFQFAGLNVDIGALGTDTSIANVVVGSASVAANKNDFSLGDPANFSDVNLSRIAGAGTQLNLSKNGSASVTAAAVIDDDNLNPATTTTSVSGTVNLVGTLPATPPGVAACVQPAFFRPDVDPKGQFNAQGPRGLDRDANSLAFLSAAYDPQIFDLSNCSAAPAQPAIAQTFNASMNAEAQSFAQIFSAAAITAETHTLAQTFAGASMTAAARSFVQPLSGSAISAEAHNAVKLHDSADGMLARATKSLRSFANAVGSAIEPTAYAENAQRTDVRSNHARGVRANRGAVRSAALEPMFAPCGPISATHICVDIGTLHAGDSVQIGFSATVNNPPNLTLLTPPHVTTQGSVTGIGFAAVNTDDPDVGGGNDTTDTPIDLFDVNVGLGSSLNPSSPTDPVTYTATITVDTSIQTPPGGTNPTGTVTFKDNNVAIGTCTNVAITGAGPWTAQCTIAGGTYVGGSSHPITATYNGDGNFDPKTSSTLTQTVQACGNPAVVTKIADTNDGVCDADCSLREAIATVCPSGTINFDTAGVFATPQTIILGGTELSITKSLTINAPAPAGQHVTVTGNDASRVFNIGAGLTVNISNLTATHGTSAQGGAIKNDDTAGTTLTLTNVTVSNSTSTGAQGGGGIWAGNSLILKNSSVTANTATTGAGGGIHAFFSLYVDNSSIDGNHADLGGGGIVADGNGTVSVSNSTISNNTANDNGGGILGNVPMTNCTVSGNSAKTSGGGVEIAVVAPADMVNVTITNNRSDSDDTGGENGGGLYIDIVTSANLTNTIIAGNFRGTASPVADDSQGVAGSSVTGSFNLIGTGGSNGLTNGVNNNQVGVAAPGLGALLNNGGSTLTHALLGSSPAIEAGTDLTTLNGAIDNVTTSVVVSNPANIPANVGFVIQIDDEQMTVTSKVTNTLTVVRAANGTTAAAHSDLAPVNPAFDQRGSGFPRKTDSADANLTRTVDIGAYEAHPTIEDIPNQTTNEDQVKNVVFNLGDDTGTLITGAGGSVTATSSNTTLVPNLPANLSFTGSGGSRTLQITPALDQSGTTTITVTVTATNGRTASDTFDLTVTAQNDNPTISANTGITVNEGSVGNTITGAMLSVTDIDNTPAQLTYTVGTAPANGALKNNGVTLAGGGTFTQSDINSNLITYDHNGSETISDSFTFTVSDGAGGSIGLTTFNITVTPQNDSPTLAANAGITVNEGSAGNIIGSAVLSVTDPDNTAAQITYTVGTAPANGTLKKSGGALAGGGTFTQSDINSNLITYDHNGSETTSDSFTFTVSDGAGGTIGLTTFNITVTGVNDAPVVTTTVANLTYNENDPATAVDPGVTISDVDSTTLVGATVSITGNFQSGQDALSWVDNNLADSITLSGSSTAQTIILTGTDTLANYQAAIRAVQYANSSDDPSTATRTVTFTVDDGGAVNNTGSGARNITVNTQNDNPTLAANAGITVNEGSAGNIIGSAVLSVTDPDNTAAQITYTVGTAPANGTLKKSGGALAGGGTFTQSDINSNLITYDHNGSETTSDSFTFTVSDGAGGTIGLTTFNITVTGVNDAPVVTTTVANLTYNENDPATAVDPGVTISDVDSTTLVGATVSITGNFQSGQDALSWVDNNLADSITLSGSSTAQTIILTGTDTLANYQAAIRAVQYANSSDNPSTTTRTVTFTVDDGGAVNNTGSGTRNITVNTQNDSPTLTTNAGLTVVNGGTGTIDNTKLKVDDADNTPAQIVFTIGTAPANGTLFNNAVALSAGGTFTQADIDANLITYTHTNLATISDSFTFTVSDGAGGTIGLTTFNITTGCGNAITVTSNADSGNGSLRQAIAAACTDATITFGGGVVSPITLTTGELVIDKNLTIQGPTAAALVISGNSTSRVFHVNPGITASISNLTFSNGAAAFGGAVYNEGTLTLNGVTVKSSTAANGANNGGAANGGNGGDGGGLYNSGTLNVINSTISGNSAGNGGNATGTGIGGNGGNGGGIYNGGTLLLINASISENNAGRNGLNVNGDETNVDVGVPGLGGGVFTATSTAILRNTIIAGNFSHFFSHLTGGGTTTQDNSSDVGGTFDNSSAFNLIGAIDGATGISCGSNGNQCGAADAPLNPLFGPLTNNGGPTETYLPQAFSPAIDAGSNALAKDQNNAALTTDQRGSGFPRILNTTVDIGSVETTPPPPPPPSADLSVTKFTSTDETLADRDISYDISVFNAGPDAATTATLTDTLPGTMTFVSLSFPAGWSCTTPAVGSGGTINCSIPSLAVGSAQAFTLVGHVPSGTPAGTFFMNTATVGSAILDPDSGNNSYPAGTTVVPCLNSAVVTTNADSGSGSLRQVISDVCAGSTITFAASVVSPITLTSGEIVINKDLTIQGPGANLLSISGNNASRIFNFSGGSTNTISGLTLTNGKVASAGSNHGGAIFNNANLTITDAAFTSNTVSDGASNQGGAIFNSGTLSILNSTFSANSATNAGNTNQFGGAISNTTVLTLTNCTFSGNSVSGGATSTNRGGGVYHGSGTLTIVNSTLSSNTAGSGTTSEGGGIDVIGGTVEVRNTIVAGNTAGVGLDVAGTFTSKGNNLIGAATGSTGFTNGVNGDKAGTAALPLNALLAALGNYGGPTQTRALLPGSPAIDAGNNCVNDSAHCSDPNIAQISNDQRGFNRLVGTNVDMGAFESRGFTVAATSGTPQSTPILTAFAAPLVATVSSSFGEPVVGGQLTFTAPGSGPSATFTGGVTTLAVAVNGSSQASASATANNTAGGPYNVTVSGAGIAGPANFSLTNQKGNQTITFGGIADKTFGDADFGISATASSGLPVSFAPSGNCTVTSPSPGTVHITGAGACTITASQSGDSNYNAAANVQQSFNIAKANQTITFAAIANRTFGDADFSVSPTASSGLAVSLIASGNCTVSSPAPGTVHITGAGSCTITASQGGNANFNAAASVPQSFTIAKANTAVAVSTSGTPSDFGQNVTFTATVTSGAGTPTGTVQFTDNGANMGAPVALNASGVAQFSISTLSTGLHTINVVYSGDGNFQTSTGSLPAQVVKAIPTLSIDDVSTTEGQAGTKVLNFTVTLSAASTLTVTANFATANGSATAGSDYVATNGTVTFNPGDLTKQIPVTINGDIGFEPDETFTVTLTNPTNATLNKASGTGTIQNDDAQGGFLGFNNAAYTVNESAGSVTVTVVRTNDVSQAATVDYATDDTGSSTNCAALNSGLASQRCDYTSLFGTLKFAANETQKTLDIPINLDAYTEGPETFSIKLSNPTGGAVLAIPFNAVVTITDSASPTPNAIDDTTTFVRQQYRDFLNRDADASGLAFWKNNIDKCNDPAQRPPGQTLAQCIEVQRITTSAAFFLSIEFRQTGGMVRDFYVASLNRPLTNNMPDFVEFMRDTQAIQRGVVVGVGNWQQVLDANRQAFMNEFVTRAEFVGLYPTTDTPTAYVDKLYQHAAVPPANPGERDAAIAEFGNAPTAANTTARAKALLRITQNPTFQQRELIRGFVHMQYFGYLRRNPNDAPDNNFDGYDFWVTKLIQFNGDFLQAEMVKAFLTSLEYRKRFGP